MYYFNTLITCIRLELPSILSVGRRLQLKLSLKKAHRWQIAKMRCLKGRSSLGKPDELIIKTWQTASTQGIFSVCISWLYSCFPHCLFHYLIRVDLRISCCSLSCWVIIVNICFVLLCGILKKSWTYTCSLSTSFLGIFLRCLKLDMMPQVSLTYFKKTYS